jgi:hypothetical protein
MTDYTRLAEDVKRTSAVTAFLHLGRDTLPPNLFERDKKYLSAGFNLVETLGLPRLAIANDPNKAFIRPSNVNKSGALVVGDVADYASGSAFSDTFYLTQGMDTCTSRIGIRDNPFPNEFKDYNFPSHVIVSPVCSSSRVTPKQVEVGYMVPKKGVKGWFGGMEEQRRLVTKNVLEEPTLLRHSEVVPGGVDEGLVIVQSRGHTASYDPTDKRTTLGLISLYLPESVASELTDCVVKDRREFARIVRDAVHHGFEITDEKAFGEGREHLMVPGLVIAPKGRLPEPDADIDLSFRSCKMPPFEIKKLGEE